VQELPQEHPLHRWFAGLVESCFQEEVGLGNTRLLDYLTDLLTDFIHVERINLMTDGSQRGVENVAEMLTKARLGIDAEEEEKTRTIHRHIGDFTLFWTGVYPENLQRLRKRAAKDGLIDYFDQGKRSYLIAADLSTDQTDPDATTLAELSDKFEYCVYGLGLVRKKWESKDSAAGGFDLFSN